MSSSLKRKRGGGVAAGGSSSLATKSVTADPTTLRTSLGATLADLRASTSRIESLLDSLPRSQASTSRVVLGETSAPAQSTLLPFRADETCSSAASSLAKSCSTCLDLRTEVAALRAEALQHQRERQAWKAFKTWWLDSLAKRERTGRRAKQPQPRAMTTEQVASESGQQVSKRMAKKLDRQTQRVWVEAGIVDEEDVASSSRSRSSGSASAESSTGQRGWQEEQQSEATLPLHPKNHGTVPVALPRAAAAAAAAAGDAMTELTDPPRHKTTSRDAADCDARPSHSTTHRAHRSNHPSSPPRRRNPPRTTAPYIDTTPVRNPIARRTLVASACPDCALFYTHLNATGVQTGQAADGDASRTACSRHRSTFQRATTPDGYWNIGFPDTQQVDEINRLARSERQPHPQPQPQPQPQRRGK